MEQLLTHYVIIFIITMIFFIIFMVFLFSKRIKAELNKVQDIIEKQSLLLMEIQGLYTDLNNDLQKIKLSTIDNQLENEQVSKQLAHRIKENQKQFSNELSTLKKSIQQQPEDRLYQRAQKLVELGADIEEIMKECDIPRVEAEIILSIHRKNN